jgi:hypothetical protein
MKKATFILMLWGALALGVIGCGNKKPDSKTELKEGDGLNLQKDTARHVWGDGYFHHTSDTFHHKGEEQNNKPADTSSHHKGDGH